MASRFDQIISELTDAANTLDAARRRLKPSRLQKQARAIEDAAGEIRPAFCGSWFGYHSRVYYRDFCVPPPGAHFSMEWGLMPSYSSGSVGDWAEYEDGGIENMIYEKAGVDDENELLREIRAFSALVMESKEEFISILSTLPGGGDSFLKRVIQQIEGVVHVSQQDFIMHQKPSGQTFSRDTVAILAGMKVPPHIGTAALAHSCLAALKNGDDLLQYSNRAVSYMKRISTSTLHPEAQGTHIFIGHGRSTVWKDLRDFLRDRLGLEWDEFNRIPTAGQTNIARLEEMLNGAAFAFLLMTAEDEQAGGELRARENVVHEAGLFQGRLGFRKAIILREEGCVGFSNIEGLSEIRFGRGNIAAAFEQIRQVLEREKIIPPPA